MILGSVSQDYLTIDMLFERMIDFRLITERFKLLTALLYTLLYSVVVLFSIPFASILTIFSGYLFGALLGGFISYSGALIGTSVLFLIITSGFKLNVQVKLRSNPLFVDLSNEIYQNQFRYLLFLRFFPVFPFWLVNLAPAILGVKFKVFFITTLFGILPGTFIIAGIGEKIRIVSVPNKELVYDLISNSQFILLLLSLSLISILPTLLKILRKKK